VKTIQDEVEDDIILAIASGEMMTPRGRALDRAKELTEGSRNADYGCPVENHQHIANVFNAITGHNISARDVAIMHQATKLARRYKNPTHYDSYVDGMAYVGIELECALAEAEKE
jgi:hypothetical protein